MNTSQLQIAVDGYYDAIYEMIEEGNKHILRCNSCSFWGESDLFIEEITNGKCQNYCEDCWRRKDNIDD